MSVVMASRSPSLPAMFEGKGKKRKASCPLADEGTPAMHGVAKAFRDVNNVVAQLKYLAAKTTSKKKGPKLSLQTLVKLLESELIKYADRRYKLDIVFRALKEAAMAAPVVKVTIVDSATDTELTPHWWVSSEVSKRDKPLTDLHNRRDTRNKRIAGQTTIQTATLTAPKLTTVSADKTYALMTARPASTDSSEETEGKFTIAKRQTKNKPSTNPPRVHDRPEAQKPPAMLVKVKDSQTFEGTLKAIEDAVDPFVLGVEVKKILKT